MFMLYEGDEFTKTEDLKISILLDIIYFSPNSDAFSSMSIRVTRPTNLIRFQFYVIRTLKFKYLKNNVTISL